jgi:Flp pilus assembly protein TadB
LSCVCYSLLFLALCVKFSVNSSLVCVILCYLFSCVCYSLLFLALCVKFSVTSSTHKRRDNRESHTQERSSLRISHTRQEIIENNTHKRRDNRESHTQERRSLKMWSLALCVLFSVTSSLFCVILCYLLPCVWNSLLSFVLCVLFSVISCLVCEIRRQVITENRRHKRRDNRESHTQERSSLRISHTRQEITENNTRSLALCVKFSVNSSLVCVILCYLLSCVCYSLLSLALCVKFSVNSSLVCVILCYAQGKWSQSISRTREAITENLTQKVSDHRESHTQGKR